MKRIFLYTIKLYQLTVSPLLVVLFPDTGCRQWPTCSAYTLKTVEKYGVLKGFKMGAARLLKCNTWTS